MVPLEQFRRGIAAYADREIVDRLPYGSLKRVLIGSAVAIGLQRGFDRMLADPAVLSLGIKTSDNMIDVDMLRDTLREQIPEQGMRVNALGLDMVFRPDDVDAVYHAIMEG